MTGSCNATKHGAQCSSSPDVDVPGINDIKTTSAHDDSTIDIKHFFSGIEVVERKKKWKCWKCSQWVYSSTTVLLPNLLGRKKSVYFINEASTLCHHLESYYKVKTFLVYRFTKNSSSYTGRLSHMGWMQQFWVKTAKAFQSPKREAKGIWPDMTWCASRGKATKEACHLI